MSPSELVFPARDGSMRSRASSLPDALRPPGSQKDESPGFAGAFDASEMARGKGFEPLAFGSGVRSGQLAGGGQVSQPLGISGKQDDELVTHSDAFTPFRSSLGIPLVSRTGVPGGPVPQRLLTVREVAKALNVSASTVYKLCAEGKLAHVRVSNAIRVHPAALAGWSGDEK